ncbi:unnamed protein product, partial [Scytosiphon promiscuus]
TLFPSNTTLRQRVDRQIGRREDTSKRTRRSTRWLSWASPPSPEHTIDLPRASLQLLRRLKTGPCEHSGMKGRGGNVIDSGPGFSTPKASSLSTANSVGGDPRDDETYGTYGKCDTGSPSQTRPRSE